MMFLLKQGTMYVHVVQKQMCSQFHNYVPTESICNLLSDTLYDTVLYSFSVRRYNPIANQWSHVTPMTRRRLGVGVAVCGGCLYAVGGSDGSLPLQSVEK